MNYEQMYKEALERAKDGKPINEVFPELKENEDERIRSLLYCIIRDRLDIGYLLENNGIDVRQALDWLEKQGEQKPAWSEEDEKNYNAIIRSLEFSYEEGIDLNGIEAHILFDWFKSIKPQNRWKPGKADILLLERIANGKSKPQDFQASLGYLIVQLKKLKGE